MLNCSVGEDSWESLGLQGDPTVHPKGNQSWLFTGRTDAEAETPIVWPPDVKNWLIGKDLGAGKEWKQEEKGTTEDEMVAWHHQLDGKWVWVSSGSWWKTGKPGVLQSMGSQRVRHDWVTELKAFNSVDHNKLWKILKEMGLADHLTWLLGMQIKK